MTESITQTHNGSGDNILGDKIINQSMQAVDFVKVAYNLYYLTLYTTKIDNSLK